MNSTGRPAPQPNAEEVYAEWARNGGLLDFDDLCRRHPALAEELGRIHQSIPTLEVNHPDETETLTYDNGRGPGPAAPRKTSRYRIRGKLAQGGMGVVYTAWDDNLNRDVALKLIREGGSKESQRRQEIMLARFLREAEITGQLDHPGVVPVHEIGEESSGRVFFSMMLVRGESLKAVFEKSRQGDPAWSTVRVLDTLVNVCQTLAFAHSRGIIHRDLKPDNVMVGEFGETYVMDWGLAKRIRKEKKAAENGAEQHPADVETIYSESPNDSQNSGGASAFIDETLAGSVLGTPSYMPPEQAAGRIELLDERSDVYSVGTLLYELIAGHRPYADADGPRGSHEIVKAVTTRPPKPLAEIRSDFPGELIAICEKAMAREQADRYQKMDEMAADLQAFLENRVVRAYQTGLWAEFKKFVSRNKTATISAALAVVLAIGASIWIATTESEAAQQAIEDKAKVAKAYSEELKARQEEQRARKNADAQRARAEGQALALQSNDRLKTDPGLALLLAVKSHERYDGLLANNALLAALRECREVRTLARHQGEVEHLAVSPDGSRLVTASADNTAIVWDTRTGKPTAWLVGHRESVRHAVFTPKGERIITASFDNTAAVWNAQTGRRLFVLRGHKQWVRHIAINADGKWIATSSEDTTIRLWNADTGKEHKLLKKHTGRVLWTRFSPDGKSLLSASIDGTARLWNLDDGTSMATVASQYLVAPVRLGKELGVLGIAGGRGTTATAKANAKPPDPTVAIIWNPKERKALRKLAGIHRQFTWPRSGLIPEPSSRAIAPARCNCGTRKPVSNFARGRTRSGRSPRWRCHSIDAGSPRGF